MNTQLIMDYLSALSLHNDREWYHANKEDYKKANAAFEQLLEALILEIGKFDSSILHNQPKDLTFKIVRDNSREEMNTLMRAMERINDASTRIGDIISEIESIASQTNLLSLNASIEAARAGESGRGFAVVAAQIRELADQSAKAAVDTRKLIEGSVREVEQGNQAAERASVAIQGVVDGIKQIADFSKNLKTMVEDQAEAMRQAEIGVNKISEVVSTNAATAQEASATSQELSSQSIVLDDLIGQFILKKSDVGMQEQNFVPAE